MWFYSLKRLLEILSKNEMIPVGDKQQVVWEALLRVNHDFRRELEVVAMRAEGVSWNFDEEES